MTVAYATEADLTAWLAAGTVVDDADRLLQRASELLDDTVTSGFAVDTVTDLPTDTDVAAAMRDACCAQVEYWLEVGEDHDVVGLAGTSVTIGHLTLAKLPAKVADRARRILRNAGLLGGARPTASEAFFQAV